MADELHVSCSCGALRGVIRGLTARQSNHCVCYCDDCQAFAHFLGRAGDILDSHGGTQIVQMSIARLALETGIDRLACVRLTPRGLLRWYATCCHTPIGNTLSGKVPFVGLVATCIGSPPVNPSLESVVGPIRLHAYRRSARGDPATLPPEGPMTLTMIRFAAHLLAWRARGDHRRGAFFDSDTGKPRVVPRILTPEEREALRAQSSAAPSR